jgi:hypothetical protein
MFKDVGPDAPIVENERGGKQSKTAYRFDLVDASASLHLARIFDYGAKRYAPDNWRKISVKDHINHALLHINLYLAGDTQDDHLGHAMWRMHAADAVAISEGYDWRQADEKEDRDVKVKVEAINKVPEQAERVNQALDDVQKRLDNTVFTCPRCMVNVISKDDVYCKSCIEEVNHPVVPSQNDIVRCPRCKNVTIAKSDEYCPMCKREMEKIKRVGE